MNNFLDYENTTRDLLERHNKRVDHLQQERLLTPKASNWLTIFAVPKAVLTFFTGWTINVQPSQQSQTPSHPARDTQPSLRPRKHTP